MCVFCFMPKRRKMPDVVSTGVKGLSRLDLPGHARWRQSRTTLRPSQLREVGGASALGGDEAPGGERVCRAGSMACACGAGGEREAEAKGVKASGGVGMVANQIKN